ncbi:hypothetical protein TrRE_jg4534 [Triparma retinervis]|uniref:PDZ domain-containing protein n=1 Tax=Triparma retinervis TaxID=2557542 RepID=A0A9W7E050_9STRA|nr:hypothetical protein TrRE_jg4534 [Triparma retinervis]
MASFASTNNLRDLDSLRKGYEEEALAITSELNSGDNPPGVSSSLVDSEGFPRGDIDIYRVRSLRQRLAILQTDHRGVMKKIEAALLSGSSGAQDEQDSELRKRLAGKPRPKYDNVTGKWVVRNWDGSVSGIEGGDNLRFEDIGNESVDRLRLAALSVSSPSALSSTSTTSTAPPSTSSNIPPPSSSSSSSVLVVEPFAKIDLVSPSSPASSCGLLVGDVILKFGPVHFRNHMNLQAVATEVRSAAGNRREVVVDVLRDGSQIRVALRPQEWEGRGLLGCHIVPYSS